MIFAAFLLPRGLPEKCDKMLKSRRQFFRKIPSAITQHRGQALRTSVGNTYCHPSSAQIMRKKPVFDGRVHIDLSSYHSLDEAQRKMLKAFGLIVNFV